LKHFFTYYGSKDRNLYFMFDAFAPAFNKPAIKNSFLFSLFKTENK